MSDAALSPEESQEGQEFARLVQTSQILDRIRSLALPVAAVGSLLSLSAGPVPFIAGAVLGAGGILAARAFNRAKAAAIHKALEERRAKGTVSPEQYDKWIKILNAIETDETEGSHR